MENKIFNEFSDIVILDKDIFLVFISIFVLFSSLNIFNFSSADIFYNIYNIYYI